MDEKFYKKEKYLSSKQHSLGYQRDIEKFDRNLEVDQNTLYWISFRSTRIFLMIFKIIFKRNYDTRTGSCSRSFNKLSNKKC